MNAINERAAPTGNKYGSVKGLMQGEEMPRAMQEKVAQLVADSRIATRMAQLRHAAGFTQKEMASQLGVTQSAISKLEGGRDDTITLSQVKEYARVTGERIGLTFGKPISHTEAVRLHANGLKYRLDELAKIANQNVELQSEIKGFLGEAFCNLFNIIALCNDQLQVDEDDHVEEIRMEIVSGKKMAPDKQGGSQTEAGRKAAKV